jgi:ferredoxin-nitrite reductase
VGVGGVTGHGDFAADLGVVIAPEQCVPVAIAIVRLFIDEGDRTDRKKARLKYVLDRLGHERFLAEVEKRLPAPLTRLAESECEPRPRLKRGAHVGFHTQKTRDFIYAGVALPVGRMTCAQMRGLADIAERYGSGTLRLTVWQNLIVSDIPAAMQSQVEDAVAAIGLTTRVTQARAGIVACTGNTGCKFAASDTKRHALAIADHLDSVLQLDTPVNTHLTGCPHSCAQHYVGDIGLLGAKVAGGDAQLEGYHLFVGGGFAEQRALGREVLRDIRADEVPAVVERLLRAYMERRGSSAELFHEFARGLSTESLRAIAQGRVSEVA